MRALEFIRDHVTFKLPYDFSYHMKTPDIIKLTNHLEEFWVDWNRKEASSYLSLDVQPLKGTYQLSIIFMYEPIQSTKCQNLM